MLVLLLQRALPSFGREHSERVVIFLPKPSSNCIKKIKFGSELLAWQTSLKMNWSSLFLLLISENRSSHLSSCKTLVVSAEKQGAVLYDTGQMKVTLMLNISEVQEEALEEWGRKQGLPEWLKIYMLSTLFLPPQNMGTQGHRIKVISVILGK